MKKSIIVFPSDLQGVGYYRIAQPFGLLIKKSKNYNIFASVETGTVNLVKFFNIEPDFLVFSRIVDSALLDSIKHYNIPYKIDLDDNLWTPNPLSPYMLPPENLKVLDLVILSAKEIIVSTKELQKEIKQRYNRDSKILPNMISEKFLVSPREKNNQKIRVLWAGSPTHENDLLSIKDSLLKLSRLVQLVFVGYVPHWLKNLVEYHPWVSVTEYLPFLNSLNCDIGIAPLANVRFNLSKSHLKLIEYSAIGLPTVTPNLPPYLENPNGCYKNPQEFELKIDRLIRDKEYRYSCAKTAFEWIKSNYILENNFDLIEKTWLN